MDEVTSNYPGENVRLLVNDVLTTYNLLKHSSNAVPATVSSMVIAKFLCCSVEEFRTSFYSKSIDIDDEERYLLGKDIMMMLAFQYYLIVEDPYPLYMNRLCLKVFLCLTRLHN